MSHLNKRIIFARRLALGKRRQQGYPPRAEPMRGLPEAGIRTSAVGHDFKRDSSLPEWHGWHAARRGLGSNLYRLGVPRYGDSANPATREREHDRDPPTSRRRLMMFEPR